MSLSRRYFLQIVLLRLTSRNFSIESFWFRNWDHYQFISFLWIFKSLNFFRRKVLKTNPESFVKIITIQVLEGFNQNASIKTQRLFFRQLSKKIIQTMTKHCWDWKRPTKWCFSFKIWTLYTVVMSHNLWLLTNLDHVFQCSCRYFVSDWKYFEIDDRLFSRQQLLVINWRMSFY